MKKIILLIVALTGCGTSYSTTQVGPDRYVLAKVKPKKLPFFKVGKSLKERVDEDEAQ